jgi:hypothetical protein
VPVTSSRAAHHNAMSSKARVQAADVSAVLSDASILERVFSFLPGNWLFLGGVCRAWMQSYKHQPTCEISTKGCYENAKRVACDWSTTLMQAVFQSPSRLRLAAACGLQLDLQDKDDDEEDDIGPSAADELQFIAGLHAHQATLSVAEELGMPLSVHVVRGAAASGRVRVLACLIEERQCEVPDGVETSAARSGSIDMLKYVEKHGCVFTRYALCSAASCGHLPALQYILSAMKCTCEQHPMEHDERCKVCRWIATFSLCDAAESGNIEMLKWLQQQHSVAITDSTVDAAARAGQTAMCAYLHAQQPDHPLSEDACDAAVRNGHVETLAWLQQHGYPSTCYHLRTAAAQSGSIAFMQYLQQRGVVSTAAQLTDMLRYAGAHNQLQVAQWLRQQGIMLHYVILYYFKLALSGTL